ncbi:hypothetical protein ENUP19_0113G0017 [Entamoeba nuttalli]|uniref:Glucosamine 6-phosphate N-acetyltransferase n=2 Tax=Entamoeba nuttalli TaxID=412467 RepID=K2G4Q0_ENTNP|nr:glucosamine 6-phosphate N-acetyltransferase, putative [Entamoeba nuttalli P19]EKE37276.1 glucosamine 6-phosphate N-acetyltransferase, putative [Entamoeba nuttalli P19]|eukprot:XP_008860396.1 glucosamine 6-phosphate N-acetyltransferase, putative [Entamoeba nuttalli P19]
MTSICSVTTSLPILNNVKFRVLEKEDYKKGISNILSELTNCEITEERFNIVFDEMQKSGRYNIIVGEDTDGKIVVTGTLLIERKFIHCGGLVGHIEDIVVTNSRRKEGLGKALIQKLIQIGKEKGCYKIVLDCQDGVKQFYEKCGIHYKDNCMAIYFNK